MLKPARKEFTLSIPTLSTLVGVAIALWSLIACGGGTLGSLMVGTPTAIAFTSNRALDGSDASNNGHGTSGPSTPMAQAQLP